MQTIEEIIAERRAWLIMSHLLFLLIVPPSIMLVWGLFWPENPVSYAQSVALYVLLATTKVSILGQKL